MNLRLDAGNASLQRYVFKTIAGFSENNRTFGSISLIPAELSSGKDKIECFIILPERTHHTNALEVISEHNLRKKLGLDDGDAVSLKIS